MRSQVTTHYAFGIPCKKSMLLVLAPTTKYRYIDIDIDIQ